MAQKFILIGASITKKEKSIIDGVKKEKGLGTSSAVRLIVNEYAGMKKEYIRIPVVGTVKE